MKVKVTELPAGDAEVSDDDLLVMVNAPNTPAAQTRRCRKDSFLGAVLTGLGGLTPTVDYFLVGNGTTFSLLSPAAVAAILGLSITGDHGNLTGLLDDDHTQYSLVNGTRAFTGVVGGITPTLAAHLTTKGYVDGLVAAPIWTVTTTAVTYTALLTDNVIICSATGITINLPTAVGNTGKIFTIKRNVAGGPGVTVDPAGAETIDDVATATLATTQSSITIVSNGAKWLII